MRPDQPATSHELEIVRQMLIQQIAEAQQLFDTSTNRHELSTSKAALKIIKQLLHRTKKQQKLDVA